ncbi:MAG: IS66 family transposase [Deltaproteobacteria bacterium]|nr:IS66 family transposase [Deltaproteobacteria bacterium]
MDREASNAPEPSTDLPASGELRGSVLNVVRALLAENDGDAILELVRKLVADNSEMARRLARIASRFKTSEKVGKAQLVLFLDALQRGEGEPEHDDGEPDEIDAADAKLRGASGIDDKSGDGDLAKLKTRKPPGQPATRAPAPSHLPRVDNPITVPPEQRACPTCGGDRVCIGHDVTEVIELIPAKVIVRRDAREKLACPPCDGEIVRAPLGDKVVPSGKLGIRIVLQMLVDKYLDGLPLHRQRERFERLGLDISVSTLCDQVKWCTDLLRPLWRAALAEVIAARVMHLDATGLPVLDGSAPGGKRIGALWGYVGVNAADTIAAYLYCSTGKKTAQRPNEMGPEDMLSLREGLTVADASNAFDASFLRPELIECGCNMHARRYFVKALDAGDQRAALAIAAYRKLYAIEDELRDLDPDAKLKARRERSKPVFDELASWCHVRKKHEPPSSNLGKALQYFTNHQVALGRFLDYGFLPLDNGIVERLHVRAALTRKNFLFAGADSGGERAAIAYTILGSCRLAGVDPIEYLADVLPKLTRRIRLLDLPSLLPSRWAAARAAAASAT